MKITRVLPIIALALCLIPGSTALGWEVELENNPYLPNNFIGVAKAQKHLYIFEKQSPLELKAAYPSIHGEIEGDKEVEGDLKTPEGVYFVTTKIKTELDFIKYGSGAYALNYPNPVDKMKQKTGYGIWIHSKGEPIEGQVTQGCVAVDLDNFAALASYLPSGTPVVLADTIYGPSDEKATPIAMYEEEATPIAMTEAVATGNEASGTMATEAIVTTSVAPEKSSLKTQTADHLIQLTKDWNKAWAGRSKEFFNYYNPDLYTLAQEESFDAFKAQKESLFKMLAWIQIIHGDIFVLEGPDYWVTYFDQFYKAPNLTSEGVRRLYWQPDESGEFRIVGMEWLPATIGLEEVYLANVQPEIEASLEGWVAAWLSADVDKYSTYYMADAVQGTRKGQEIFDQKTELWQNKIPKTLDMSNVRIYAEGSAVRVQFKQIYTDSTGYKDIGMKDITFVQQDGVWRISREDWRKI